MNSNGDHQRLPPLVGIVVVNFNGLANTRRCLASLRSVDYSRFETVVVDNGSTDESMLRLPAEFPEIHFLRNETNKGFTGGTNSGIRWYLSKEVDLVLILNNDAVVDSSFLQALVAEHGARRIVAPQIRSVRQPDILSGHVGRFDWLRGIVQDSLFGLAVSASDTKPRQVDFAGGCCLLMPRRLFDVVGLFDDAFFLYYEDADLLVRAKRAGFELVYVPDAVIYHDAGGSSGGQRVSALSIYYTNRNRLYFMRKHRAGLLLAPFLAYFFATRAVYAVFYVATGRWSLLRAMVRGLRDFFSGKMSRALYQW